MYGGGISNFFLAQESSSQNQRIQSVKTRQKWVWGGNTILTVWKRKSIGRTGHSQEFQYFCQSLVLVSCMDHLEQVKDRLDQDSLLEVMEIELGLLYVGLQLWFQYPGCCQSSCWFHDHHQIMIQTHVCRLELLRLVQFDVLLLIRLKSKMNRANTVLSSTVSYIFF